MALQRRHQNICKFKIMGIHRWRRGCLHRLRISAGCNDRYWEWEKKHYGWCVWNENTEGAFGIYARERAPSYHFVNIGIEGYLEGVSLNFYQDKYYIKLTAFSDDAPTKSTLTKVSQLISQRIGGQKQSPAIFTLFPAQGRVKHTENYDAKSYLGKNELREAYSAKYSVKGKSFTMFLVNAQSKTIASTRLHAIKSAFTQTGFMDKEFSGLGNDILTGKHRDTKEIVIVAKDKYLLGVYPVTIRKLWKSFETISLKNWNEKYLSTHIWILIGH